MYRYFLKISNTERISLWKSKRSSDEIIKPLTTCDDSLAPALSYTGNKTRVKFDGACLKQDKTTFTHGKTVNIYIAYEINLQGYVNSSSSLFGALKLVKTSDIEKCKYSGDGTGFDMKGTFSFPTGRFDKNVIIFGVDISSSVHIDHKKKYILILGEVPMQRLDDTTLNAEKTYQINFTESRKKFCLSLHYNGANNYLFINCIEIQKFKAKDSEINAIR